MRFFKECMGMILFLVFFTLFTISHNAFAIFSLQRRVFTSQWVVEIEGGITFSFQQTGEFIIISPENLSNEYKIETSVKNSYSFRLNPSISLFVVKGFEIGVQPIFIYSQNKIEKTESFQGSTFEEFGGGGDVIFRYIVNTKSRIYPFIGLNVGGVRGKSEDNHFSSEFDAFEIGPQIGLKFVLGGRGILSLLFSYRFQSVGYDILDSREARHSIEIGSGLGFFL